MTNAKGRVLKKLRLEKGYSLAKLGEIIGVGASTILSWEREGLDGVRADNMLKLAELFNVSPGYLLGWEEESVFRKPNVEQLPEAIHIPLLGTIACGDPLLCDENTEDKIAVPKGFRANFALRCRGDSMILARIYDGDLVYIRQQPTVENGEIAAVLIGEEATLKRFYRFPDHIELRPENPRYEILRFTPEESENIRILGKAVAFVSRVS